MSGILELSAAQCILLTVHLASEGNIKALHSFTPNRLDALDPELVLRILSTFLPESIDPSLYTTYVGEVASRIYLEQQEPVDIDTTVVTALSDEQARKRVKKLHIEQLTSPGFPPHAPHAPDDLLTRFLCHRAHRIDAETGLLTLIPELVLPFIGHSDFLRSWFISLVLPLVRLRYEYYPGNETPVSLEEFEKMNGTQGLQLLLARATHTRHQVTSPTDSEGTVARDLRGLVGPWMYGHTERKRRKLHQPKTITSQSPPIRQGFIPLEGVSHEDKTGHCWENAFHWLVHQATHNFPLVTNAIEEWDGPGDVDLGLYNDGHLYLKEDTQSKLELQYAQAAFAACYAVEADSAETIDGAHGILVRLAELLEFEPPPDLATSVQQLPKIDSHAEVLHTTESTAILQPDVLLEPEHPLTTPKLETYMLLQMFVYTAYQLANLGHKMSILHVATLRFFSTEEEQLALLHAILHTVSAKGKRDEQHWLGDYHNIVWLWNWNINVDDDVSRGAGIFGNIPKETLEKELLKVFAASGSHSLIDQLYLSESSLPSRRMSSESIEQVLLDQAMQFYDSASNGNRTRGGMKKASDLVTYAQRAFPKSEAFRHASALIAATHSLSFYSLKLHHNVPFQPVNIRASSDPLTLLLPKVLEQNPNSYTKLDDMVSIGRNLVAAGLPLQETSSHGTATTDDMAARLDAAERRVIALCVEASLSSDDFETAYSYIVNRLAPPAPSPPPQQQLPSTTAQNSTSTTMTTTSTTPQNDDDDTSWRCAFLAGRHRPRDNHPPTLRRLSQSTDLLSLALLLAPPPHLSEILSVWRRCEEETASLLATETAAQQDFDDRADDRRSAAAVPGGFGFVADEEGMMVFGQGRRREVGRVISQRSGGGDGEGDEAPVGLFELAKGAAGRAIGRGAFPLRGVSGGGGAVADVEVFGDEGGGSVGHMRTASAGSYGEGGGGGGRVRRRDMLAGAVTGGLASGIGWVLGATPVDQHRQGGGASGGGGGGEE